MRQPKARSGLILIELMAAIVFLAVTGAICTQLFVKAHLISTRSRDLRTALGIAQNMAETVRGMNSVQMGALLAGVDGALPPTSTVRKYCDSSGAFLEDRQGEPTYLAELVLACDEAPLFRGEIAVFKVQENLQDTPRQQGEALCVIQVSQYVGGVLDERGWANGR